MAIFAYKVKNDDRDRVVYLDDDGGLCGANFYGRGSEDKNDYDNVETILTEDEYEKVINRNADEKIFTKLQSEEAQKFFAEIVEQEKAEVASEYNLSDDEVNDIFEYYADNIHDSYQDKSIIGIVYKDTEELGDNEAWSLGLTSSNSNDWKEELYAKYFDYKAYGEDLCDEDPRYYKLNDGRVVALAD